MEKQVAASKMARQRRFMLVLPLLILPFVTMAFWALGGGQVEKVQTQATVNKGFNINLPDAKLKDDKKMDKLNYYNLAQQDSLKFLELEKNDPNYKDMALANMDGYLSKQYDSLPNALNERSLNTSLYGSGRHNDPSTDKIYSRLAELNEQINKPVTSSAEYYDANQNFPDRYKNDTTVNSADMDRMEQMMNRMNQPAEDDPELNQLDGMLDKILEVQHPERVEEKLKRTSEANRGEVFAVTSEPTDNSITRLGTAQITNSTTNGFYSINDAKAVIDSQNAIQAVIHETQTVVDGSIVKLRLLNDVFINGVLIPKDNFVFGIASLNGERLSIRINSIRYKNSLFPVALSVYDMDGLDGIYIPGAITRDVAKQSAERSIQALGLTSLDPSWQAQAAGAGIEAAKTLFSQKVKLIKVTVKAGYQVLLRDEKQKQAN
ncbi:conjugative transposon protein TraM [Parafilimonas sp.]|uniref:conjugative transposon protein TraM n=1 Tax=Parafilimonas sp. TaxID=1969739 RepID=UPI0039E5A7B7